MTPTATFDVSVFVGQDEGQHFDRKSLYHGERGKKRARGRREVRDQIAEYVAAFANSEGGVLILGVEDDGTVTGHQLPDDAVEALLATPTQRLTPPQPRGSRVPYQGVELLVFDVPAADGPVMVDGDGFPLRMGDRTVQASETQIRALKLRGLAESWESGPSPMRLSDLDDTLLERARRGAGLSGISNEEYLLKRKLADLRRRELVLRRGAELLFAKQGPDHPNAGLRIFRVVGTERRLGPEHNVEERPRVEGNLPAVLTSTFGMIEGFVRHPSRLVGNRFRTVPEYPEFCWKEALLNAAAHRDYTVEGRTTEVWFFDDRLEVTSPGGLVPDVHLDDLLQLRRVHVSRNPRTVRVLVDLAFMRDQGEGIPRMFAEMEGLFLPTPQIEAADREFRLTLRNTPTLTAEDRNFVAVLGDEELTDTEFKALLEAYRAGRVDNARMRIISGLDTLGASQLLRRLRDRGLLDLHAAGPASYYELGPAARQTPAGLPRADRPELEGYRPESDADRLESDADRPELEGYRPESDADRPELPRHLANEVASLGPRPRQDRLRDLIERLCAWRELRPAELGALLGIRPDNLTKRHLSAMVDSGRLIRAFPDHPNRPDQAYRARQPTLPTDAGDRGDPDAR